MKDQIFFIAVSGFDKNACLTLNIYYKFYAVNL